MQDFYSKRDVIYMSCLEVPPKQRLCSQLFSWSFYINANNILHFTCPKRNLYSSPPNVLLQSSLSQSMISLLFQFLRLKNLQSFLTHLYFSNPYPVHQEFLSPLLKKHPNSDYFLPDPPYELELFSKHHHLLPA